MCCIRAAPVPFTGLAPPKQCTSAADKHPQRQHQAPLSLRYSRWTALRGSLWRPLRPPACSPMPKLQYLRRVDQHDRAQDDGEWPAERANMPHIIT